MTPEYCSFCGNDQTSVGRLISGGGKQPRRELPIVTICERCIRLCVDILADSSPPLETELQWVGFVSDGSYYEWSWTLASPPGHKVLMLRQRGEAAFFGLVLDGGEEPSTAVAQHALQRFRNEGG